MMTPSESLDQIADFARGMVRVVGAGLLQSVFMECPGIEAYDECNGMGWFILRNGRHINHYDDEADKYVRAFFDWMDEVEEVFPQFGYSLITEGQITRRAWEPKVTK